MRYVVIGCGAIGGTVAAGLVRDGHDVLVCDADPAVVAAINARGLRIEGPVENFTVGVPAVAPADLPAQLDGPVLVAVKAQHTAAAAALLAGRLTDGVRGLAAERPERSSARRGGRARPGGRGARQLRRRRDSRPASCCAATGRRS